MEKSIIIKGNNPRSEQEMLEASKLDNNHWELIEILHNVRPVTSRKKGFAETVEMRQTKAKWKPKYGSLVPEWSVQVMETLLDKERPVFPKAEVKETGNLGGLMLTDLHLNASDVQGNSFNKRAKIVNDRIARVMDRLLRFDPERLLIPNLGDMNNSEVKHLTSSLKTPMQDNLSMEEGYKRILEREISMLEGLQQYGLPMKYVRLGGNHDDSNSKLSTIALQYFFKDSDIEIDTAKNRYYEILCNTMIALSHGDRGEGKKLFEMVVDECISKTRKKIDYMYAILGHHHRRIITQEGPLEIINVQAPAPKTEFCEKYGMDMKQSMSGFVFNNKEGKIIEVRG